MSDVFNLIVSQPFLQKALIVGVLISLCAALLGVSLVLKRFSMIGDGLSHVGFGAMAIASAANIAPLYFSLPIVVFSAFLSFAISVKNDVTFTIQLYLKVNQINIVIKNTNTYVRNVNVFIMKLNVTNIYTFIWTITLKL